jgi:uncharacterized caspase-like protein
MRSIDQGRRETLKRLSGLSLAQLFPFSTFADTASLNALPRVALVIGNSAYRAVPELRNPANDAAAIAGRLKDMRFEVISRLDTGKPAMEAAIREYCDALARGKSVGLFYFAGHGFQMGWKNYLVPVDAALAKSEDVAANTIDLTTILDGLRRAGNPMNIVILDACRDNPFGVEARSGKGLSQVDAPVGTLLAYATSPGNTASDGERDNGLYTETLLREMRAPDTRIEDIFKRVRLNVRRASNGQQIPWESTSLEDDFYFIPPPSLAKPSHSEIDRKYAEELALWQQAESQGRDGRRQGDGVVADRVDDAIAALETYLRRYPSGHFNELAQVRLDRLLAKRGEKRVLPAAPATPFTKGMVLADTGYQVGDRYELRITDVQTGIGQSEVFVVTEVTESQIVYNEGRLILDPLGNPILQTDGRRFADTQHFPAEFVIGRKWSTRFKVTTPQGYSDLVSVDYVIKARESVRTAAGTFDAFRVEGSGWAERGGRREYRYWAAPDKVRRFVINEMKWWDRGNMPIRNQRAELVSFRESRAAPA